MSASAPLLTGKHRRRALQALIAATLLALGIAAGSGTAHADGPTFTPAEVHLPNGNCSVSGWPHGTIFCGTSIGVTFPNQTQEIFGVGLDGAVWTDWGTEAHPSGWKSMGDPTAGFGCDTNARLYLRNIGNYVLNLGCYSFGGFYLNDRSPRVNGTWSGWFLVPQ
jgi:hypothetical protein